MHRKKNILLFVTIPTHLRILVDSAKLLQSTGLYNPVLVFYPSAVFDNNRENCQNLEFETWIWNGKSFSEKTAYIQRTHEIDDFVDPELLKKIALKNHNVTEFRKFLRARKKQLNPYINIAIEKWRTLLIITYKFLRVFRAISAGFLFLFKTSIFRRGMPQHQKKSVLVLFLLGYFKSELELCRPLFPSKKRLGQINTLCFRISELFAGLNEQVQFLKEIPIFYQKINPSLIILPEENIFYNSHFITKYGHEFRAKTLIMPFTIVNTLEWAEAFYPLKDYHCTTLLNKLYSFLFPQWTLKHKNRKLILPKMYILGCEYFDNSPSIPWLINSGIANAVAAESQFMSDYYSQAGIAKEKIHLTGTVSDDITASILNDIPMYRQKLGLSLGIQIKKFVVLIALPPNQFSSGGIQDSEFKNYTDLLHFMVSSFTNQELSETTIILSPHPRIKFEDLEILKGLQAHISTENIEKLVPLCDLFVAVSSATIRLAMNCGIESINFNAYRYNYDDYQDQPLVMEIDSKLEYSKQIEKKLFNSKNLHLNQKVKKQICSMYDGQSSKRILNLIDSLINT